MDLKRALAAYVSGRNGGWDSELKSVPVGDAPTDDVPTDGPEPSAHTGVPVPTDLAYERGPGTWRNRLGDVSRR